MDVSDCTPTSSPTVANEAECGANCNMPETFLLYKDQSCNCYSKSGANECIPVRGVDTVKAPSPAGCPPIFQNLVLGETKNNILKAISVCR